jgi:hypothetical protein
MATIMITAPRTPQTIAAMWGDEDEDVDEELRDVPVLELRFGLGREFDTSGDVGVGDDIAVGCGNDTVVSTTGVNAVAATVMQMISHVSQRIDTA